MWATIRNISDRKESEKQLLHFQKMEAVGTLAGGIAHDFNNLLQAIQGYVDLLLIDRDAGDPDYRKLQQIAHAAQRGGELTRQLLTFSRKAESKKMLLDLNREVGQAVRLLQRTIPKMIDIELRLAEPLKAVEADPVQVEQIIMNLAINAKDAMPEGGRLIIGTENASLDEGYCRTHLGAKPGDYVLLTVADTGHGINRGILDRIFEPFFTTKEVGKGTGLGLAIVYGIVKSHHGYISCFSEPGEGTSFKIYLPARAQAAGLEEQEPEAPVKAGTETVLLVDDEDAIRDLGKQILERFGYKVLTAVDGESALDLYRREQDRIDLVVLDLIMPGMGGKRCLEELLKANARARVLIASGYSDTVPIKETVALGAKNFIGKPYEIRKMLAMVRQVLDEDGII
jgi:nitrogen-specific signal transduction histidine kinase/ActR/RegA family two-component response regulator